MDYELEHSRLEQRNRDLHKQGAHSEEEQIHPLQKEQFNVAGDFGATIEKPYTPKTGEPVPIKPPVPKSMRFLHWFAAIAISSAIAAIGYFGYQFLDPSGKPSPENIIFTMDTPVGANPGEPIDITVKIANKNNVALDTADIVLQLPAGSYEVKDGVVSPVKETHTSLGIITAGETGEYKVRAYILGDEQQLKDIKALLSYKFINMGGIFTKNVERQVRMLVSPVVVEVDTLKRATAGREVKATISVRSNTEVPLRDVLMSVEYPQGFVFQSAEPRPNMGNGFWIIPQLEKSESASFVIEGMFTSEGAAERVLHTRVGVADVTTPNEISSQYQEVLTPISLEAPFVDITTLFNEKVPGEVTARYGVRMPGSVTVRNNTTSPIVHAIIEVTISGTGLNEGTVEASKGGIYRAQTGTIVWDERNDARLAKIEPGSSVGFAFSFVPDAGRTNGQYAANPEIRTNVAVRAERENEAGVVGEVRTLSASVVKIATQAEFATRALFYTGPIKNIGEMPPKVDKDTQMTIVWNVRNTSNSLEGAEVRAVLPPYVRWGKAIFPKKETVRFDDVSHEVVWSIGTVPAGTGVGSVAPKEVAFQVVITPTKNQVGNYPLLIDKQIFRATDSYTSKPIEIRGSSVNTSLPSDSQAERGIGKVVE